MKYLRPLLTCLSLCLSSFALAADAGPALLTPAIPGYGGVVHLPAAAAQLDPAKEYKLVFDITRTDFDAEAPLPGLDTAARFLNLAALAGVPRERLHIVLVIHGPATAHALSGARYQQRYGTDNPSLDLIDKLVAYGVQVYVCGQALAGFGFAHDEVNGTIEVAVAAITVLANRQMDGYALLSY